MGFTRQSVSIAVGALVVTLLQLVVAPYVTVFNAMPNFMAAYAVVITVLRPRTTGPVVLAFVMGLLYNLFVGGVVGSLSAVLVIASVVAALAMRSLANDTSFQPLAIMAVTMVIVEVAYLMVLLASGLGLGFVQALIFRALLCAIYDAVMGALLFFIMSRVAAESERLQPNHGPTLLR